MIYTFRGGVHLEYNKEQTHRKAIEVLPSPARLTVPLRQHIGAPCQPLVQSGDYVQMGQVIGDDPSAEVCSPVHSPVSGQVVAVEPRPHSSGDSVMSVVIDNDFEDTLDAGVFPVKRPIDELTPDEISDFIRSAGIVGMGGAGFPTHVKLLSSAGKKIDRLIINGAECEPYITIDHRIMLEEPHMVVGGIRILMRYYGLSEAYVGIEENKLNAADALSEYIKNERIAGIKLCRLRVKYPQGGEKQLISAITRREVPPGRLPADVGCAVFNVDTCAAIYRAYSMGLPLINRHLTVSGTAVAAPKNLLVRIGTPISCVFERCEFSDEPQRIVMGGPMMGTAQYTLDAPVMKTTSALLAFSEELPGEERSPVCIRCGRCVEACPMRLMPNYLSLFSLGGKYEECERLRITDCMECGSCAYICPGKLHLVQSIRSGKFKLAELKNRARKG